MQAERCRSGCSALPSCPSRAQAVCTRGWSTTPAAPHNRRQYLCTDSYKHRLQRPARGRLAIACKQRKTSKGFGFGFEKKKGSFRLTVGENKFVVPEDQAWQLGIPVAMLLVSALVIGPLIVGLAMAGLAVGAAMSMGALAVTTLLFPLIALTGFFAMLFGGIFVLPVATVGFSFLFSKFVALSIAVGGLGLGWLAVQKLLLPKYAVKDVVDLDEDEEGVYSTQKSKGGKKRSKTQAKGALSAEELAAEEEARRLARELREFDEMLAAKEEQQRLERWRNSKLK